MNKIKTPPLLLFSLLISAIAASMTSYRYYESHHITGALVFIILAVFLVTIIVSGLVRNRRIDRADKVSQSIPRASVSYIQKTGSRLICLLPASI